jgi:hypothetical protein
MGNINADGTEAASDDKGGEASLRGAALHGSEQKKSVDHTAYDKKRNPDTALRLDGEEDTLYDDGLELDDDSTPLTGINGRDDSK